jgi:hypothetical protein
MRRSDSLRTFSPRFVCPSLGDTIPRRLCSLRSGPTTAAWGPGPSGLAVPVRQRLSRWSRRASQVPGEPCCAYAVFFDPGETDSARPLRRVGAAPVSMQAKGSRGYCSRGSIARPEHWLSTLRRVGLPTATQDSLPAAGQALPGGIGYPQSSNERFPRCIRYIFSPFPKLSWRKHGSKQGNSPAGLFLTRSYLQWTVCPVAVQVRF